MEESWAFVIGKARSESPYRGVKDSVVEVSGTRKGSPRESGSDLLIEIAVIGGVESTHVVAIGNIDVLIFPGAYQQVMNHTGIIGKVR